jgi:hypothetical protein
VILAHHQFSSSTKSCRPRQGFHELAQVAATARITTQTCWQCVLINILINQYQC